MYRFLIVASLVVASQALKFPGNVVPYDFGEYDMEETKKSFEVYKNLFESATDKCFQFVPRTAEKPFLRVMSSEVCYADLRTRDRTGNVGPYVLYQITPFKYGGCKHGKNIYTILKNIIGVTGMPDYGTDEFKTMMEYDELVIPAKYLTMVKQQFC
ncbi:uncharacterized protein LOC141913988 [Tubulanus polymorphus]|uniref:uncharacterized protein LOC141913988 n=1 Tax=Tubulanus polymorphus TaxID=672921 RepID=UPI003DA28D1B